MAKINFIMSDCFTGNLLNRLECMFTGSNIGIHTNNIIAIVYQMDKGMTSNIAASSCNQNSWHGKYLLGQFDGKVVWTTLLRTTSTDHRDTQNDYNKCDQLKIIFHVKFILLKLKDLPVRTTTPCFAGTQKKEYA